MDRREPMIGNMVNELDRHLVRSDSVRPQPSAEALPEPLSAHRGNAVCAIGGGRLIACFDEKIAREEVGTLALGIAEWSAELESSDDSTFADDVAKTALAAILQQRGLGEHTWFMGTTG